MLRGWIFATLLLGAARGVAEVTVGKMRSEQAHGFFHQKKSEKNTKKCGCSPFTKIFFVMSTVH